MAMVEDKAQHTIVPAAGLPTVEAVFADIRLNLAAKQSREFDVTALGRIASGLGCADADAGYKKSKLFDQKRFSLALALVSSANIRLNASLAQDYGIHHDEVRRLRIRMGASVFHVRRFQIVRIVDRLSEFILARGGDCVALTYCVRYDETPMQVKAKTAEQDTFAAQALDCKSAMRPLEDSPKASKLVQFDWSCALLFHLDGKFHQVRVECPMPVRIIDRGTAEVYAHLNAQLFPHLQHYERRFRRVQRLCTTDSDGAVLKAERHIASSPPLQSHLHVTCEIHKVAHIAQRLAVPADTVVTGMVNISLSLSRPGGMGVFRRILRRILKERVVKLRGSAGPRAEAHRRAVLDLYCPNQQDSQTRASERGLVEWLANGDFENCMEVQHYCSGCCQDEEYTKQRFQTLFVNSVARRPFRVFPRSKWTGADEACRALGLLASMHGLLSLVYQEWASHFGTKLPKKVAPTSSEVLAEDGDDEEGDPMARAAANWSESVGVTAGLGADASGDLFRQLHTGYTQRGLGFVAIQGHSNMLMVFSAILLAQQQLMHEYLKMASESWSLHDSRMCAFARENGQERKPKSRAIVANSGELEAEFMARLESLLLDNQSWRGVGLAGHVVHFKVFAFKLITIAGASCHEDLATPHRGYPWKTFCLAADSGETLKEGLNSASVHPTLVLMVELCFCRGVSCVTVCRKNQNCAFRSRFITIQTCASQKCLGLYLNKSQSFAALHAPGSSSDDHCLEHLFGCLCLPRLFFWTIADDCGVDLCTGSSKKLPRVCLTLGQRASWSITRGIYTVRPRWWIAVRQQSCYLWRRRA